MVYHDRQQFLAAVLAIHLDTDLQGTPEDLQVRSAVIGKAHFQG